jgi:hypothetical protein
MNAHSLRVRSLSLSAILLLASACDPPPPPPLDLALAAFGQALEVPTKPALGRTPLQIYVDSSQSMRGFANVQGGRFCRLLDQLLDRSVAGGYEVSVYSFDKDVAPVAPSVGSNLLRDPLFFQGSETSFPVLFTAIRKARRPGGLALVLTDLVQSGKTGEQRAMAAALRDLATQPVEVVLIALRSPFVGRYWPESTRDRPFDIALPDDDVRSSRPFYALLFADQIADIELLRRRLRLFTDPTIRTSWELDASKPAIAASSLSVAPVQPPPGGDAAWQVHTPARSLAPQGRTPRFAYWLVVGASSALAAQQLRFELRTESRMEIEDPSRLSVTVQSSHCRLGACQPAAEWREVPVTVERSPESSTILVTYGLPMPAAGTWDAFRVQFLPGPANLLEPVSTALWTTDDDSRPEHANRTFKLDLFVDTMLSTWREQTPIAEQYLFLGRPE